MSDPQVEPVAPTPAAPVAETVAPVVAVATPEVHGVLNEIEATADDWEHVVGTEFHALLAKLRALF